MTGFARTLVLFGHALDPTVRHVRSSELRSRLSGMDKFGGGLLEPLRDAHRKVHVRHASGPQISQSARRAAECLRQLRPCETAHLTLLVERGVELVQVPPEPTVGSRLPRSAAVKRFVTSFERDTTAGGDVERTAIMRAFRGDQRSGCPPSWASLVLRRARIVVDRILTVTCRSSDVASEYRWPPARSGVRFGETPGGDPRAREARGGDQVGGAVAISVTFGSSWR